MRKRAKSMVKWGFRFTACLALFACGGERRADEGIGDEVVLAQVGEYRISAGELRDFESGLRADLRSQLPGVAGHREHLQGLIDRQIMLLEARQRGIDKLPNIEAVLDTMVDRKLIERMVAERIDAHIQIDEEELKQAYEEYGLGWEVWPAHILSKTEEDAREIIRLVEEGGADFSQLAKERSLAADADKGGNLGGFFGQEDAVPSLREGTFHLEAGQLSEPIRTMDGYEVVKILDKRRLSFAKLREGIARQMGQRKWAARRAELVEEYEKRWGVRYHRENTRSVLGRLQGKSEDSASRQAPFISYDGGMLSVEDCARRIALRQRGVVPTDSLQLYSYIESWILPDMLMALTARAEGWDREPELLAWRARKRDDLMISQLRIDQVAGKVKVEEGDMEAYYQKHLDSYKVLPGPISLTEVIVETKEEAEEVLAAARSGERLEQLAVRHSLRPKMAPIRGHTVGDSGRLEIGTLIVSPYREFFGDVNFEAVGKIQGPLRVQDGYSVFRLDEPVELVPRSFTSVREPIRKILRTEREGVLFAGFIDSLRQVYAGQVSVDEEALSRYAAAP